MSSFKQEHEPNSLAIMKFGEGGDACAIIKCQWICLDLIPRSLFYK